MDQILTIQSLLNLSGTITIIALIAINFTPLKLKATVATCIVFINAIITSWIVLPALSGKTIELFLVTSQFSNIPIRIDGLSAWFILIINFNSITGVLYGSGYLKAYNETPAKLNLHWIMYMLFQLSMIWVCLIQHGFAFLVVWEIMSLTSFMLVIFDHTNIKTIKAGLNYFVQMHISIVFLTIGFIWVYYSVGSFDFAAIECFFAHSNSNWLFLMFFIGFALKAGFIPMHSWLPHAHPAAPSHVSGVMSGVIVKLGIYGIIRMATFIHSDFIHIGEIIIIISILTGLYGILNAAVHRDFKRMLAYCTIENIGIIGVGIGIGMIGIGKGSAILYFLGFGGALLHVLNHSLFKSLLFYAAGSVYQQTHTRNMDQLGGLLKQMPKTGILFLIGAIAIAGIPPFNGFISEFIIYSGLLEGMKTNSISRISLLVLTFAGISIIGGISILAFTKTFSAIFLGSARTELKHKPTEVPFAMLLPQYLIVAAMLSVAFFPTVYLKILNAILCNLNHSQSILNTSEYIQYANTLTQISLYSGVFIIVILAGWFIRSYFVKHTVQAIDATWGCGYVAPNNKMQYTSKSFSKPLAKILNFLLIEHKQYTELKPGEIFPKKRNFSSFYFDFIEHHIIDSIINRLMFTINYFKFIQNGRIQSYVFYGIVFIIAILILSVFNILK